MNNAEKYMKRIIDFCMRKVMSKNATDFLWFADFLDLETGQQYPIVFSMTPEEGYKPKVEDAIKMLKHNGKNMLRQSFEELKHNSMDSFVVTFHESAEFVAYSTTVILVEQYDESLKKLNREHNLKLRLNQ